MKSKIINMADRIKDAQDRLLEDMFAFEPVADDGFSERIVRRIRRRLWIRRLALPVGAIIGVAIAAGPFLDLVNIVAGIASVMPLESISLPNNWIPQLNTVVLALKLVATGFVGTRALAD